MVSSTYVETLLKSGDWTKYVARPVSLFVATLWHEAYKNYIPYITQGVCSISDGIFIQEKNGVVCNYRKIKQLNGLKNALFDIYSNNKPEITRLLGVAKTLNTKAQSQLVSFSRSKDFENVLDLLCRVTVFCAVFPRFLIDILIEKNVHDSHIFEECENLRKISLYPKILMENFLPVVSKILQEAGVEDVEEYLSFVSIQELRKKDFSKIKDRIINSRNGKNFIYVANELDTEILWSTDTEKFIEVAEGYTDHRNISEYMKIKGHTTYPGLVRARARICITFDGSDIKDFEQGDVLVSINSNPNLIPWIQKSGALITDEGGITCHAAVLSRELRIPCIIDTKNATKLIRDGSWIEVNADKGIISVIKN